MQNQGLVRLIILIIIVAIVLGYFGIDLKGVWESKAVQNNIGFLVNGAKDVWQNYLAKPANYLWGIFYNYMWLSFMENLQSIKMGDGPTLIQ
ncbi:hypothetical protein ACFLZC_03075 [Patescibacteria group bacterium]